MTAAEPDKRPAEIVVEHLTECHPVSAVIVFDGNGDEQIAQLLNAGWSWMEGAETEYVAGKRIRYLTPPERLGDEAIFRALGGDR